jgi:hypothetical protein
MELFGGGPLSPQAVQAEPKVARPGSVITISGVALGKPSVEEVFLTDQRFDMKVKVLEQTDTMLRVRVPPMAKPGRQQLLLLVGGEHPAYLEQPVYVLIEVEEQETSDKASPASTPAPAGDRGNSGRPDKPN